MKRSRDFFFESGHLSSDLAGKSMRGGMTTITSQGVLFILSIAGTMILARILTPNDYGLVGMVTIVVNFAQMFKDAGLSMATIQKDHISHEQISTLFWLNMFISVVLGLCVLVCSPLVSKFYGRPELTAVTAALSVSFVISGITIQHQALLRRKMQFGALTTIQIVSQISSLIVTIFLGFGGWRYWALVGGAITLALVGTSLTLLFCPWVPGRTKKGTGVREMLKFGSHLTGFNFVNYFSRNLDNILIGKYIGANALGLYARAYQIFMMPITQIREPMNQVAIPVLCSLQKQPDRYIKYFQRLLDILATLTIPVTIYCAIEADFLIKMLLGSQWTAAVPVFRILAVSGLIQAIAGVRGLVLISFGFSERYFIWGLFNAIICASSFVVGLQFGIEGVAAAYAIVNYIIFIPSLYYCFHKTPVTVTLFMKTMAIPLLACLPSTAALLLVKYLWINDSLISHCFNMIIFVSISVGMSLCRSSIRETLRMFLKELLIISPKTKESSAAI